MEQLAQTPDLVVIAGGGVIVALATICLYLLTRGDRRPPRPPSA